MLALSLWCEHMNTLIQAVEQQYLTKAQAQTYTGLSERTLDYARERGELKFYKRGKWVLFKKADLDAWMERHRAGVDLDKVVNETVAEVLGK
jgi:excisionase family DNA binding protein